MSADILLAGVDGCPGGWIAAFAPLDFSAVQIDIVANFAAVLARSPTIVAVDMPIGLPARVGPGGRAAENAVRPLLGARQSSVFSVPSRAAVDQTDYREACRIAAETSDPPRKVSKQLFHLMPKIREVDAILRNNASAAARVYEVHPEVAFWRMNGGKALSEPKKLRGRGHDAGLAQRRALLIDAGVPSAIVNGIAPRGAGADDLLDALACLVIARRIHAGTATPFPDPPPRDAFGLPMAIWA